jgi:hypothetical protein
MRFGLHIVRSLYTAGSLMTVSRELSRCKLDLVGVQKVRWVGGGISTVKSVEFVSDRMSYIILRGGWCHIIVVIIQAPTEDKTDDMKDSFYEELERVFGKFPTYHMKILLGDFNAKVGRDDIFKPTIGNKSLHEISNDNEVTLEKLCHI